MLRILLAVAALAAGGAAHAQVDRRQADQIFIANSGPRGVQRYKAGDYVLKLPLVWEHAARLRAPVTIGSGKRVATLPAGTVLPAETLLEQQGGRSFFLAYCTPNKQLGPKMTGEVDTARELGMLFWRSLTDGQSCFADRDRDGSFEQTMTVGAGWGAARAPRSIVPVAYEAVDDAPISPRDEVRIKLAGVTAATATFVLDIVQRGTALPFDQIGDGRRITQRKTKVSLAQALPIPVYIYGAVFEITGFDVRARTVTLDWPADASLAVRQGIPDEIVVTHNL